jgi:hypothetical protein
VLLVWLVTGEMSGVHQEPDIWHSHLSDDSAKPYISSCSSRDVSSASEIIVGMVFAVDHRAPY